MDWHFKLRDMSKFELVRLIERYDRYIQELYENDNYTGCPISIEEFMEYEQN